MPRKNRREPSSTCRRPRRSEATRARVGDRRRFRRARGGGDKEYRCPGCDHIVRAGLRHLVVVPEGAADARRHWHTECWRTELRRSGRLGAG